MLARGGGDDNYMPRVFFVPLGPSQQFKHFHSSVTVALMADLFNEVNPKLASSSSTVILSEGDTPSSTQAVSLTTVLMDCRKEHPGSDSSSLSGNSREP